MRCLIVDDEELNREFVATMLHETAECEHAESGSEAISKFKAALDNNTPFDLVLLDILMPGISGHDAGKAIRSIEKERGIELKNRAKIVMLTALNSTTDAMEAYCSVQSAAYLVKPISKANLHGVISKLGLLKKV